MKCSSFCHRGGWPDRLGRSCRPSHTGRGAVADPEALDGLPAQCANRVRVMIRRSPWPGFLVKDLTDLADQANHAGGLTELPISIYRPRQAQGPAMDSFNPSNRLDHDCRPSELHSKDHPPAMAHRVVVFR